MLNEKIEEIANDLNMHCCSLAEQFCGEMSCNACLTNYLYNAGYRKTFTSVFASDTQKAFKEGYEKAKTEVAVEIFEKIEDILAHNYICYGKCYDEDIASEIAELKKKYTGEGK